MKRQVLCSVVLCLLAVAGISAQGPALLNGIRDTAACRKWVDRQMEHMTLKQKVGQLFIYTLQPVVTQYNKNVLRKAVEDYAVGGLLFTGGEARKQVQLTNYAQSYASVPLMVTFDGEWGLGMRLKGTPSFPYNRVLGCIQNDSLLYAYGKEVARQCHAVGVQVNFAPVADVDNNPQNPVINFRSFGSDPKRVADKVVSYTRGLEDGGVLAVCKHFPGHGDTEIDSHKALPELNFDRSRLDSIELYPFRKAIEAGIGGVMVGHLHAPVLGEEPASISQQVIMHTLIEELRFQGLVVTDALEMKGIAGHDDVCALALMAGNDMLLAPRNLKKEIDGVMTALKKGTLSKEEIDRKCRKVLTFKYALGLSDWHDVAEEGIEEKLQTPELSELQQELSKAAVTVLKDSSALLPLDLSVSGTVLLSVSSSLSEAYPFYNQLHQGFPVSWMHADADSLDVIAARLRPAQRILVALHSQEVEPYASLLENLAADKPLALVCFEDMKVLEKIPVVVRHASTIVLAHSDEAYLQREVANLFLGSACADGRLSIPLAGMFKAGDGITIDPDAPRKYCPADLGMDASILAHIDSIAEEGIRLGAYPGCHVMILREGLPVYNKCFGYYTYEGKNPVRENSLYDLASLTKVTATLLAVMKLYDEDKFGLTDRVSDYLPALKKTDKSRITVQDLLFHESGLPAYLPFYEEAVDMKSCKGELFRKKPDKNHTLKLAENVYACNDFRYNPEWVSHTPSAEYSLQVADSLFLKPEFSQHVMEQIVKAPLKGKSYRYSCLNFMLLKEMVEKIAGMPMDSYLDSVFYTPMGLRHIAFRPLRKFAKEEIVPSVKEDYLRGGLLQGFVQDEAAAFMGGVSGNAGLFATAHDVAKIAQMWLDKGVCGDRRYLSRATCELFMTLKSRSSRRGLGFDKPDVDHPENSPCTPEAPASVFGHTGYTGTCVWVDPEHELVFVFLSNRTYPSALGPNNLVRYNIRTRMQQAMYQSLMR